MLWFSLRPIVLLFVRRIFLPRACERMAGTKGQPGPDKFYKGGSQEKTLLLRPEFFLLPSPRDRGRAVLTYRAMCSVAGQCAPVIWIFSTSGFHRFFATKPVSSETKKQNGGQIWQP